MIRLGWYSEEGVELKEETLIKLYEAYQANARMNLDLVYKYRDYFGVVFSVLTSLFVAGMVQFYKEPLSVALLPVPFLMFYLAISGKTTTKRYYKHFLESIVVVGKIENMLGIDCQVKLAGRRIEKIAWPDDKQLVVDRYSKAKYGTDTASAEKCSKDFVESRMKKGEIATAKHIFSVFQIVSIILIVALVFSLFI